MPPTELPLPEIEEVDTPYKRRLALAVALLALFGGLVAFAASDAGGSDACGSDGPYAAGRAE